MSAWQVCTVDVCAYRMDPEPSAVASFLGTSGQLGNLELRVKVPDAGVVDGEDGEVIRLEGIDV